MMTEKDFFFCYDRKLMNHIKSQGINFLICARQENTHKKFWMFKKSEALQKAIDSFRK